jgi:hypothetical protein
MERNNRKESRKPLSFTLVYFLPGKREAMQPLANFGASILRMSKDHRDTRDSFFYLDD